jgi:hypothetical protein
MTQSNTLEHNTCIAVCRIANEKLLWVDCAEDLGHETEATANDYVAMDQEHLGRGEAEDELAHHYAIRGLHRSSWRGDAIGRLD